MKWKTTKLGDKKTKKKFAWFPTRIEGDLTVWLQSYFADYEYRECQGFRRAPGGRGFSTTFDRWVLVKCYCIELGE